MRSVQHNTASRLVAHRDARGAQLAVADEERRLDYRGLDERIARCAALLAEAGVARGDRVALVLGNRSGYLETVMAAARLAAIATPLNARLTAPELSGLLAHAAPRVLIHDEGDDARIAEACRSLPSPPQRIACGGSASGYERRLAQASPREAIEPVSPDDPMLLMYTSGTTGTPKGALLPHRKTLYNSLNAEGFFSLTSEDRVLVILPLFHSFGLKILALPALHAGASLFLHAHFDAVRSWRTVGEERISFFGAVPTQLAALREALEAADEGAFDLRSLRFVFGAGAAVPVDLIRDFQRHGLVLQQGFGQTETSILCCLDARDAVRKAGSVGRPVRHAEVRVVTLASLESDPKQWRETAVGETGEIVVRGPITMLGYWKDPEATAQTLRGEWLRTGDLATRDEEGFLTLVGRARHMYISGGENVYPAEIERVYAEHPAVREIAVVGVPDEKWGEVGCAYVVPADGARVDADALRDWGSQRLARFKLPKRFLEVKELPRTETGKVQKHRLARPPGVERP
jgi:fatty-acyl-CoA synthase